jgi:hypothetical protein
MKLKGYLKENSNGEFVVRFADIITEIRPNFIDLPIENLGDYIGEPKHGDEVTFTVKTIATGTTEFDVIDSDVAVLYLGNTQTHETLTLLDSIVEYHEDEEILKADGFDRAVIGIELGTMRLVYSVTKCLEILMVDDEMSLEDAIEYFEYNVRGSYVGEKTPIWCEDNYFM